jgi:hypothetical protein
MGLWDEVTDRVFGMDPGPAPAQLTMQQKIWLYNQQQQQAAEEQARQQAAAAQQPVAPPPTAPVAPAAPAGPVAPVFDPSPFRSQVDSGFSQFTPEFYANKFASFYDPYKGGVESQYGLAKDTLGAGVAKRGLAGSQQSRGLFQQLDALRDQALTTGQSTAQGFQSSLSDQVGKAKESLYGSIGAGNDNASIGTRSKSEADRIAGSASPSTALGDIFGGLVGPYASTRSPGGPVNPELQAFSTGANLNLAGGGGGPAASTSVVGAPKRRKF